MRGGGRPAIAIAVLLSLALPAILAQSSDLQAEIDAAGAGSRVQLPGGTHAGALLVNKALTIEGIDRNTKLTSPTGPVVTIDADDVGLRFVEISQGSPGILVTAGHRAAVGPAVLLSPIQLAANATLLLRNDPGIPVTVTSGDGARLYFSRLGQVDARNASGALVPNVTTRLLDPDGVERFAAGSGIDLPTQERLANGTRIALAPGWTVRIAAPGYETQDVPISNFTQAPLRLTLASSAPAAPAPTATSEAPNATANATLDPPPASTTTQEPPATDPSASSVPPSGSSANTPSGTSPPLVDAGGSAASSTGPISTLATEEPLQAAAVQAPAPPPPAAVTPAEVAVAAGVTVAAAGAAGAGVTMWRSPRKWWKLVALFAPLFTRLKRDQLLDQPLREKIHATIVAQPGIRYRELQREIGVQNGVLAHHLQILAREKLVREEREGRAVRLYAAGAASSGEAVDTGARVLAFVRANPGATGSDVARGLDLTASLAGYHLQRLEGSGALRRERDGGAVRAYVTGGAAARDAREAPSGRA